MDDVPAEVCCFEAFLLDRRSRELRRTNGDQVPLTAKAFDTLCYLVDNRERVVGKDELLAAVWPGRVVEENNLSQAISTIRRALGTEPREHRYLVTVPGRGYRFVAEVHEDPVDGDVGAVEAAPGGEAPASVPEVAPLAPGGSGPDQAGPGSRPARRSTDTPHSPLLDAAVADTREARPVRRAVWLGAILFAGALLAASAWRLREPHPSPAAALPPRSLAVLPFKSLSPQPHDPLLEAGLADTLVTHLARSPGLRVRSLASVQAQLATGPDATTAGRALGAEYVVEGSTQRVGTQLRVNARLLQVGDGSVLWADTFDTRMERVFTLQDRIGAAVTSALAVQPGTPQSSPPSPCDGDDAKAYRAVLRAQFLQHRRDQGTIAAFHEAIRHDPTCSRAYAGLAMAHMFMAHNDAPPGEVFPLARAAIDRALAIDPAAPDALAARGRYLQLHAWDWQGAEAALKRAIVLNPSLADARLGLAHLLVATGRFDEGLEQARQARELDPLSPFLNALEAGFLSAAGQPDAAQVRLQRALELEPDFWIALLVRGGLALDRGEAAAAVADLERAAARSRRTSQVLAVLAAAQVAAGDRDGAGTILRELQERARSTYVPAINLAAVHNALGDTATALDLLERAHAAHDIRIGFLGVDARWNNLRGEPRFKALAQRMRLAAGPAQGRY